MKHLYQNQELCMLSWANTRPLNFTSRAVPIELSNRAQAQPVWSSWGRRKTQPVCLSLQSRSWLDPENLEECKLSSSHTVTGSTWTHEKLHFKFKPHSSLHFLKSVPFKSPLSVTASSFHNLIYTYTCCTHIHSNTVCNHESYMTNRAKSSRKPYASMCNTFG